jgi:hypothetical protein
VVCARAKAAEPANKQTIRKILLAIGTSLGAVCRCD